MGDNEQAPDPRYEWVMRQVVSHFKTTNLDNFSFSQAEEASIYEFLDNSNAMSLWFTESRGGNGLTVSARAPTTIKTAKSAPSSKKQKGNGDDEAKKGDDSSGGNSNGKKDVGMGFWYVVKLKQGAIEEDLEAARTQVMVGDLPPGMNALEHMGRVAAEVYLPMVTNPKLKEVWSEMVMKDVTEGAHGFMANVQITSGRVGGMTMLPLPPDEELNSAETTEADLDFENSVLVADVEEMEQNKERIHVLEGTIITWTKQIKAVLKQDPETLLNSGSHPGPLAELGFWKSQAVNLNSIFEQLQTEKVRRVLRYLDRAKSTYTGPFGKLCKEMFMARIQANSNHKFLRALRPWLENMEGELEFEKLPRHFRPIMHTILLIWKGSPYYNSPARLVVIMRELCNTLISKAAAYLSGDQVFELIENEQPREAIEKLRTMLRVFGALKSTYFDYKSKAAIECVENPWRVQNNAIFVRLDAFLERCHDVLDLTQTILQFSKLAKVEVGGTKGKVLTTSVMQIYADFLAAVDRVQNVEYDIMDLEKKQFEERWYEFRGTIKELDQRLGSVVTQGFDDCTTVANHFKLLDSFDSLVKRPAIADDLERKYVELISLYLDDLHQVQHIFMEGKEAPPIASNLPPIAGALSWIRGLQERVQLPMDKLRLLDRKIMEREEAREAIAEYTTFLGHLDDFRKQLIQSWGISVESSSQAKLRNPLLRKERETQESTELLYVNFDPGLTSLLREVKYFLLLGLAVPDMALEIFGKGEIFRRHMGNLELIVSMYNFIQTSLLPVERPLLKHQLDKIDRLLSQGIGAAGGGKDGKDGKKSKGDPKCLSWKSNGIELFINEANTEVQEVHGVLAVMKENLSRVEELLDTWSVAPLLSRYNKASELKDFEQLQRQSRSLRYAVIKNGGTEIHKLLKDTIRKLKVSQGLPDWKSYVDFINNIVVGGLVQVVIVSLEYLEQQVDPLNILKQNLGPMVEIELDLVGSRVMFQPDLDLVPTHEPSKFGIRNTVQAWIDSFMSCAGVFKRLDSGEGSYLKEMQDDPYIQMLLASINTLMMAMVKKGATFRKQYEKYSYLWETDLAIMFDEFIADATIVLDEDGAFPEDDDEEDEEGVGKNKKREEDMLEDGEAPPPPKKLGDDGTAIDLMKFDLKIREFLEVQAEIADLKPVHDMDFLRINAQPIKQALGTCVTKWMFFFTQFLQDFVATKLTDVFAFVGEVSTGLDTEVVSGDRDSLMAVMGHIRNVRKRMKEMDRTFEPLREIVMLLKTHGIPLDLGTIGDVDALDFLENAPMEWDNTVNKTFRVKELIQPMQNTMVDTIKAEIAAFSKKVDAFVAAFHRDAPFRWIDSADERGGDSCSKVYAQLDGFQKDLVTMEKQADDLEELEELFELATTRHSRLTDMGSELGRLKLVWDTICLANFLFSSWKPTLWADIKIDDLLDETSTLTKQIKRLPRTVRDWDVYQALEQEVKNMAVVLPLVQDLRSPAMRDRHWKALVTVTRKHFEKTPSFALEDLLALELHRYVEGVQEVVETATKELKVESKLKAIAGAWDGLSFEFDRHRDTEVFVLVASEEVLETLEDHQMQLQSMASMGRFVEFFKSQVDKWQFTLGNVETVVKLLLAAQKSWSSLEAIFLASADIRSSLPDDTKRFEEVDAGFKELMVDAKARPGVVDCCNTEGREATLQGMNKGLEKCQRALNEYLDMKKNVFPRFYFVSNMALLDILSNGNNAPKIMPHLGSVFDGVGNLDLELTNDARTRLAELQANAERDPAAPPAIVLPDSATAMVAKDGETIKFPSLFIIQGAVENWLTALVQTMQDTLRASTDKSLAEAGNWEIDRPREDWTLNYPAQVALLVSQMVWTEETEGALEEFENGAEDAIKKYNEVCTTRLEALIRLVQGDLSGNDRNKVITLITIDVHNRDMVGMLVEKKVESAQDFAWQSQLKFYWDPDKKDVGINICDFSSVYSFEYVGNCGRLVITPLTDRCYVTLTTALRLFLGGAPAGPAGTGKTETTKDLARGLGVPCYVFNCSDQFNYQTMADIFKGLSQVGAWGCFDEFNRIPIEVLSVVATQVKLVQDAILKFSVPTQREDVYQHLPAGTPPIKVGNFDFFGQSIFLIPTCGFFITMNPGYAGRTELPENLKALFRSCAMIRPDLKPICENMLMAEGFVKARPLAIKFVTLYALSSDLLSKQAHYDWGLRAVKSVLRVAGTLKRAEPRIDEEAILMRALRDFNTPKIPLVDLSIFLRLISDIFPGLDLPTKFNQQLKEVCVAVCGNTNTQADDVFVGKVIQYQELLDVRHSVMLLGPAGAGKSKVWKTLANCHNHEKPKPTTVYEPVNPKAVTGDELYGYMTLSKDWKEGCLSIVMRNMSKEWAPYTAGQTQKWVVLDGDIDAVWIESMNTVMDDNKVLTLVSNERIPLTPSMRMIFEIHSLKNATPATVSRAGILYLNETDVGWAPFVESWMHTRENEAELASLAGLFDKHVPVALEVLKTANVEMLVPMATINMVSTICYLLEGLMEKDPNAAKSAAHMERLFLFAAVWAFGGVASADKGNNSRLAFSSAWKSAFGKVVKYPDQGTVFDYYVVGPGEQDLLGCGLALWNDKVPEYSPVGDVSFSSIVVPTADLVRLTAVADLLVNVGRPVLLVGGAGTGKTTLVREYLKSIDEVMNSSTINMNYYTDAATLQAQLEMPIDKRSGKTYGPPAGKKLVYFVDDLNMPFVEQYGTQTPIELLRQHMDYQSWFDRSDLGLKRNIVDVQYMSAMNHKSGSFFVNPRLQRHYATVACQLASDDDLKGVYESILSHHVGNFTNPVQLAVPSIVDATINMHKEMSARFLPSAVKFHYNFTMRDLSSIFQGICLSQTSYYRTSLSICRLWFHECSRVFGDRLISAPEIARCNELLMETSKRFLGEHAEPDELFAEPLVFTKFATATIDDSASYLAVSDNGQLKKVLEEKLAEYNDANAIMNLVLFDEAMMHVARIARIIGMPRGNALLVGVGGSGKQSLSRLASFICGMSVQQISMTSSYGINDLKEELKELYRKAGVKPAEPLVFMMTDSHVVDERFLVYINDLLSSGVIPDLFTKDEYDAILGGLRNAAKAAGVPDARDQMMEFFIDRVRSNLHIVLCMSPVGDALRVRARKFPGLINCTAIDWFHEWPKDALVKVAHFFLSDIENITPEMKENISHHMSEVHLSVSGVSAKFLEREKRHNHTTPKSFLELINFYKGLLGEKRGEMTAMITRYDTGLTTLRNTNKDVEALQEDLKVKMVEVEKKKQATNDLLEEMGAQRSEAEAAQAVADQEKEKADQAAKNARTIQQQAQADLDKAQPALEAAEAAVNGLDKASMTELKGFNTLPAGVDKVAQALLILVKDEKKNYSWDNAKKMMAKVDAFKQTLEQFDGENIDPDKLHRVQPILDDPIFTYEKMKGKSGAAANLCNWVVNICEYNRVYKKVKPLMEQLHEAKAAKAKAEGDLEVVLASLRKLDAALAELQTKFLAATEEKAAVEAEAAECSDRLSLAERLTMGLAAENERWGLEIDHLKVLEGTVLGDVLLSAAFVSYVGAFSATFRAELWQQIWIPDLQSREIPITEGVDPIKMLASDAVVAEWMNEGLPADRISMENGAIITNGQRWPLIIDPQLQGIKWIRSHEETRAAAPTNAGGGFDVIVTQIGMKGWMGTVTNAIQNGNVVILENLGQAIDAVLDPVLSRAVFRKGRNLFLRLGGEDIEYDPNFKLYLQTKLANPHYKPEIAAQCSIINFIVTEHGLEDQLLAKVVAAEQPKLESDRLELVKAFNQYKIQLKGLEDELLERLANAPEDILSDVPLIEGLEATKEKATEINAAVVKGKQTEIGINKAREVYRPIAHEASLLYFMLLKLCLIDHMYQYSLDSFNYFFAKGMEKAKAHDEVARRVLFLQASVRWTVFLWTCRGLFEEHKLIFLTQLTFGFLQSGALGDESGYSHEAMNFLLRTPRKADGDSPVEWLTDSQWGMVGALSDGIDGFGKFQRDLEDSAPRFLEWFNHNTPETEKLPLDWRQLDNAPFRKLLVIRCLRPDRLTMAISKFVRATLPSGAEYTECDGQLNSYQVLEDSFQDSSPEIPIYFILSKGSNIVADVDKLAAKFGMVAGQTYHNISLGQGQDIIAEERLENGHRQGHWVILNNVHLMPRWLSKVEKMLDDFKQEGSHQNFRIFLSSDPANSIPIGILERCIKLTSDPPSGLKANLKQAFCTFSKDEIEEMEPRTKGILFGLCHFHAIMLERKKFGPKGFNMMYPFSIGDLVNSAAVLRNYMENAPTHVPWQDLRYLFGQIMYGGHIIDDFDRLMCSTYLEHFMKDAVLDEMELFPFVENSKEGSGFLAPTTSKSYDNCLDHIDQNLVGDSPVAFGMHPNAEIAMRTDSSEKLMKCILELSAAGGGGGGGGGGGDGDDSDGGGGGNSPQNAAEAALQDILEQFRDQKFDLEGITGLLDEVGPYQNVFLQECERLNVLLDVMTQSLTELDLGFRGELTMSEAMEAVQTSLFMDRVPAVWQKVAFPSQRSLGLWTVNLQSRLTQMADWATAPSEIPISTWISGLFNPQSFLTAIMQITAQAQALELDKLVIFTEVTKKLDGADVAAPSRDGAFIHGLSLEGARWNVNNSLLETSQPREMYSPLPAINCRPVMSDKVESGSYECPVYMTQIRGPTFVFKAALRTKAPPAKWILAGVAAIMDII